MSNTSGDASGYSLGLSSGQLLLVVRARSVACSPSQCVDLCRFPVYRFSGRAGLLPLYFSSWVFYCHCLPRFSLTSIPLRASTPIHAVPAAVSPLRTHPTHSRCTCCCLPTAYPPHTFTLYLLLSSTAYPPHTFTPYLLLSSTACSPHARRTSLRHAHTPYLLIRICSLTFVAGGKHAAMSKIKLPCKHAPSGPMKPPTEARGLVRACLMSAHCSAGRPQQ